MSGILAKSDLELKFFERPLFINMVLVLVSTTLLILKLIFGLLTNSIALQADAFDSLTDIVIAVSAIVGFLFSKKKPNEKFPYGYYKMENIVSLFISLFIFFSAYTIIVQSITDIFNFFTGNPKIISVSLEIFIFLAISLIISCCLTLYLSYVFKKTKSPIIESETKEKLTDIFISISVLIGFIGVLFNFSILDSFIGLAISGFIIKGGYDIFLVSIKTLLDAVIDFENRSELYKMIEKMPKVKKIDKMEIRSYGRFIFLELDLLLTKNFPFSLIDTLREKLFNEISAKYPQIFKIIIEISSPEKQEIKIAVPLENSQGEDSVISNHFGESLFFAFISLNEGLLSKLEIVNNSFIDKEKRKGILISDWLISEKIDRLYLKKELNKGPSLILENNFVEVILIRSMVLKDIIDRELNLHDQKI